LFNVKDDPYEIDNLYENDAHKSKREELTLLLTKRLLGVKVRDVGMRWPTTEGIVDVRFESLHKIAIYGDKPETNPTFSPAENTPL
jgi:hypothetical protein